MTKTIRGKSGWYVTEEDKRKEGQVKDHTDEHKSECDTYELPPSRRSLQKRLI